MPHGAAMSSHEIAESDQAPREMVRLRVREPLTVPAEHVLDLLAAPPNWLGSEVGGAPAGMHRYAADLRLRVSDRAPRAIFRKAAYVDFGPLLRADASGRLEVSWSASTLAPLFPVFSGTLSVRPSELLLDGIYAPPGGRIGMLADRALLHLAARGTARWLLSAIERAADRSGGDR
jgi:hypothetical protein